jgi:hypothetical protein
MQQGSIIKAERKSGLDVWEFRWREPGPDGKRKHRRMVIGRIDQFVDESARGRIAALHLDINFCDARLKGKPLTISELAEHYRQRELKPDSPRCVPGTFRDTGLPCPFLTLLKQW